MLQINTQLSHQGSILGQLWVLQLRVEIKKKLIYFVELYTLLHTQFHFNVFLTWNLLLSSSSSSSSGYCGDPGRSRNNSTVVGVHIMGYKKGGGGGGGGRGYCSFMRHWRSAMMLRQMSHTHTHSPTALPWLSGRQTGILTLLQWYCSWQGLQASPQSGLSQTRNNRKNQ